MPITFPKARKFSLANINSVNAFLNDILETLKEHETDLGKLITDKTRKT